MNMLPKPCEHTDRVLNQTRQSADDSQAIKVGYAPSERNINLDFYINDYLSNENLFQTPADYSKVN